jgi:Uma2 family endonuclease
MVIKNLSRGKIMILNTVYASEKSKIIFDTWIDATWEEFISISTNPELEKANFYYENQEMRIEMAALGIQHGRNNSVVYDVISLWAIAKSLRIVKLTNTSFRKTGSQECQPDSSFYIGDFPLIPYSNSPIDLDNFEPPHLVVEVATTSLSDDLGRKRLLYEQLGVEEYWVVDGTKNQVLAFRIVDRGSNRIKRSLVLPGLEISTVEEALRKSETEDDGAIARWLLEIFKVGN